MTQLRHLYITGMDCDYGYDAYCHAISEIPGEIRNLKELVSLRLNVNTISHIPEEIVTLKHLKVPDLSDDASLKQIKNLERLAGLEELCLYGCYLTILPERIGDLKQLKILRLYDNHFSKAEQSRIRKAVPDVTLLFNPIQLQLIPAITMPVSSPSNYAYPARPCSLMALAKGV